MASPSMCVEVSVKTAPPSTRNFAPMRNLKGRRKSGGGGGGGGSVGRK